MPPLIIDLHTHCAARDALLHLNNANARATSLLTREKLERMIGCARIAICIEPAAAFLLAFDQGDDYDGTHFQWFRDRFDRFLYIDRVVVGQHFRRSGLGKLLYADLFKRAEHLGHTRLVCEVNALPANPASEAFHAALGFEPVGIATMHGGTKTVRYLLNERA